MQQSVNNILFVSNSDRVGGAAQDCWNLFQGLKRSHIEAWMAVKDKTCDDPDVFLIHGDPDLSGVAKPTPRQRGLRRVSALRAHFDRSFGLEDFHYPRSREVLGIPPRLPRIVHCHNLHEGYFDLRSLMDLSRQVPVVVTLHDTWLLAGNCAYYLDCDKWLAGCGKCPDHTMYPGLRRDATAWNWKRKRRIYKNSILYVSTPSRWMMENVSRSILAPAVVDSRVIPYGIDLDLNTPGDKKDARASLNLPQDEFLVLFTAVNMKKNPWKDYQTFRKAVEILGGMSFDCKVTFLALGQNSPDEVVGNTRIRYIPFERDRNRVITYFQASDVYVHAAKADNFPFVILEALACGLPVVATGVGGIPEQVRSLSAEFGFVGEGHERDEATGMVTPPQDAEAFAAAIATLIRSTDGLVRQLAANARQDALGRFGIDQEVARVVDWYAAILD